MRLALTQAGAPAPSDASLRRAIRRGSPGTSMPSWRALSEEQVDNIIATLRTFTGRGGTGVSASQ